MSLSDTYPGLRVLDLATNFAGPYAAMILGDMGADVIKVERAPKGDDTRSLPPYSGDQSTVFLAVNRNKRSIMLDFKSEEDRIILRQLVADADVVIESFPPGVAEKLGLTYADVSGINPRVLLASVSAFGDGPIGKTMPGYDALVQAVSGLMSFTGNEGEPTARIAPSVLDLTSGIWTAMGVMAALARRGIADAKGEIAGEHVKIALIDTAFNLMNHQLMAFIATGNEPRRLGGGAPSAAPYGIYPVADGELLIATASQDQFVRLCDALDIPGAKDNPHFSTMTDRIANREEIDRLIIEAVRDRSIDDLLETLREARISAGRVNSVAEACALPVTRERNLFGPIDQPDQLQQLRLPLGEGLTVETRPAPALDQHRAEILDELAASKTRLNSQ